MELADALAFARGRHQGVLVTIRSAGRPQLSNIVYALGDDAVARLSVTDSRAKVKNLRRDPRASLYVPGDDFWHYVVLDGTAALGPVADGSERRRRRRSRRLLPRRLGGAPRLGRLPPRHGRRRAARPPPQLRPRLRHRGLSARPLRSGRLEGLLH